MRQPLPPEYAWVELSEEFYQAIGRCIAAWANVDAVLFSIFCQCVGPIEQCAIIYYRTPGLDARLGLTDEIVRSVLLRKKPSEHDHPDVKAWQAVRKDFSELLSIRRRIAHHPVMARTFPPSSDPFDLPYDEGPHISGFEIFATQHERLRGKESDQKPLTIKDLRNHIGTVMLLSVTLGQFLGNILLKRPAAPSLPSPPRLPEISPKTRDSKGRQRRGKSSPQ